MTATTEAALIKALAESIGPRAARAVEAAYAAEPCSWTFIDRLLEACRLADEQWARRYD